MVIQDDGRGTGSLVAPISRCSISSRSLPRVTTTCTGGYDGGSNVTAIGPAAALDRPRDVASYVAPSRVGGRPRIKSATSAGVRVWISGAFWPATGGTTYERIQLALARVPSAIRELNAAVKNKTEGEAA